MSDVREGTTSERGTAVKGRLTPLWVMLAVFAAPGLAALFFYLNPQYLPTGRSNLGELISPVVAIPADLALVAPDGVPLNRDALEGKWTLVYLAGEDCADPCRSRLWDLRQIRVALGEASLSTERLLIMTDLAAVGLAGELATDYPGMHVALTDQAGGERLLGLLGGGNTALDRVYILDPMGNLMMRYAPDAPAKDTLNDMGRLIKASKNWIKGADYGHK